MNYTLLEIVQKILSDMDSEEVNSISDSVEALQIASVVEDTFYNIISTREVPEHKKLITLTALSDIDRPTHFTYPSNTKEIEKLFYNTSTDGSYNFTPVYYQAPLDFLNRLPSTVVSTTKLVIYGDYRLIITTNRMPRFYTSFDDDSIVMDSHDSTIDTTLTAVKTRAYGTVYPTFSIADDFIPDLDNTMMPLLLAESKSTCFSLFKSGPDLKVEQAARRLKSTMLNDVYKSRQENRRPKYGR